MSTPKWKTRAYMITGWIGFSTFLLVIAVDVVLAILKRPTFSQYVTARGTDQPLFMAIVIGITGGLMVHWFYRVIKKMLKK